MSRWSMLVALFALLLWAPASARAQDRSAAMRAEWTLERSRNGQAEVAGYVYNGNSVYDGANVWLRVERLGPDGAVSQVYRRRVVGDVLAGGRLAFAVPVADATTSYRVVVESVDWVRECR